MTGPGPVPMGWRRGWTALAVSSLARAVLGALVLLLAWSLVPVLVGWQSNVVMTGSMGPRILPGDVVLSHSQPSWELALGDVLVVEDPDHAGELRVHRLVAVRDGMLQLRGDANPQPDSTLVSPEAVVGTGALRVPWIGSPRVWVADRSWTPLLASGSGLLALAGLAGLFQATTDPVRPQPRARGRRRAGTTLVAVGLVVVSQGTASAAYRTTVANGPDTFASATYYRCATAASTAGAVRSHPLQETSGTTAANTGTAANAAGTFRGGVTLNQPGPACAGAGRAVTLNGSTGWISTATSVTSPSTFTIEIWFRTTAVGGKLIGFGDSGTGASTTYDRHLFLSDTGTVVFGVDNGAKRTVTSTRSYIDGAWHLATATLGAAGMVLYVDGASVASDTSVTTARSYTGFWRFGWDTLTAWGPSTPTRPYFNGSIAHAGIYNTQLSAAEIAAHHASGA